MFDFLKNKLLRDSDSKGNKPDDVNGDKRRNPINEIQVLEGHQDIVRFLIKIDELRLASASDDGTIKLWNRITGECLETLTGHTHPITCMILLETNIIVTGSADKTIRLWNLQENTSKVLRGHEGSVKCIVSLDAERFCSGSNDRHLFIWNLDGEVYRKIERQEEENIHCLLPISGNRLVTGSNSSLLLVYKTDTCTYHKMLAYHRESVRCLVKVSANSFASASMDGAIVIWKSDTLAPLKILNNPEEYRNKDKVYIYNVKYLLCLSEKYLAAAIGTGFKVYDTMTQECVLECRNAHEAEVNHLISVYDGTRIVSCSADSSIKLWGTTPKFNFRSKGTEDQNPRGSSRNVSAIQRSNRVECVCLGEMWAHSDSVNQILFFTENNFASCSSDNSVILWKDGRVESELRNRFASLLLHQQNSDIDVSILKEDRSNDLGRSAEQNLLRQDRDILSTPPSELKSGSPKTRRVPDYIFDYAERLRKENMFTLQEVADDLRKQGHGEAIVSLVLQKQMALNRSDGVVQYRS
eukprot:TRINITY_DN3396_c0_g1_i1.p1 TRINITY_DN3396_c0_g1~~TRINITY_DN3396_c0_g1_i1.p1  ORF type:complete len:525 (-),score=127.93 TRINITY_DN3396_c0_g1_i1:58-1632(-)